MEWAELGAEYAKLLIAAEHGIDLQGNPVEREFGNEARMNEIENLFHRAGNYTLSDYVENAFQELGI